MRVHALRHVPFEGLGHIEPWLAAHGHSTAETHLWKTPTLPPLGHFDWLIAMGGPMSVNDEAAYPWLAAEKALVRSAIEAGKRVLGICLGAQLVANAMGARVYPNPHKEIGWFPIQGEPAANGKTFQFPPSAEVFHWHGETFDLPSGATLLAQSCACKNQAFQLENAVVGLQFHLETTPESAREMVAHCRAELSPAPFVQSESDILSAPSEKYRSVNRLLENLLAFLQNAG